METDLKSILLILENRIKNYIRQIKLKELINEN